MLLFGSSRQRSAAENRHRRQVQTRLKLNGMVVWWCAMQLSRSMVMKVNWNSAAVAQHSGMWVAICARGLVGVVEESRCWSDIGRANFFLYNTFRIAAVGLCSWNGWQVRFIHYRSISRNRYTALHIPLGGLLELDSRSVVSVQYIHAEDPKLLLVG